MKKTIVIADSCCDVPKEVAEKLGIRILPVHIVYPEKDYLDGVDIDASVVYERFPKDIPKTSMPSPLEVEDFFGRLREEGYTNVIAVCISNRLSGTVSVVTAVADEFPDMHIFVYDTRDISIGSGIFAVWAAWRLTEGATYDEIIRGLEAKRDDSHQMFYMDTLDYLQKGGRIGNVAYMIANVLRLKPIISCDPEGVYYTPAKIRGAKRAKERLLEEIVKAVGDAPCWVAIMHGGALQECIRMKELVRARMPHARIIISDHQINPSLAVHTGPGLVGVLAFVNP